VRSEHPCLERAMTFGSHGVRHEAGHKLSRRELAELKKRKEQEDYALSKVCQAKEKLDRVQENDDGDAAIAAKNVEICSSAIEDLITAVLYDEDLNAAFFWRAEAFRIRAISRRNAVGKEKSKSETRKVDKAKKEDLRCALGDCDHVLRFYDPSQEESAAQSWIVWLLRGRIRAGLGLPPNAQGEWDYDHDFDIAKKLDTTCSLVYTLHARCQWRNADQDPTRFEAAMHTYEEGLKYPHNPQIKATMIAELEEVKKQKKEWDEWTAEEAERCKCACSVM